MKRILIGSLPAIFALGAACAATEGSGEPDRENVVVPEAGGGDAGGPVDDGAVDGGCDASDPSCVTKAITCAEAAWCPSPTGVSNLYALTAVWGSGGSDVWAAGSGGNIVHWDGTAWKPTPTTPAVKNTFSHLVGSGPNDVWAISATDTIFHSTGWNGSTATWTRMPSPFADEFTLIPISAAWAHSSGEVRLGGPSVYLEDGEGNFSPHNQLAKKIVDGGVQWQPVKGTATLNAIWGASPDDLWVAGDNSQAAKWQLGMTMHGTRAAGSKAEHTWVEVDSQASVILEAIWGSSAADVWAVGDKGTIRHITAGAVRWDVVPSPTTEALHAIWGAGPSDIWAVGDNGTIIHWDGQAWKPALAAFPVNRKKPDLYGVWGAATNDVWIVGSTIALHHTGANKP